METSRDQSQSNGDAVRHIAIQLDPSFRPNAHSTHPSKTGMSGNGSDSDRSKEPFLDNTETPGQRTIYILVRKTEQADETPVFRVKEQNADAVLVFTYREAALLYLQVARWTSYGVRELSPIELSQWVPALESSEVAFLIVNANRRHHERSDDLQNAIDVRRIQDLTGENLYQEVMTES